MANIGDTIGGGVLFYSGATSGLVASSVDIPFFWGGNGIEIVGTKTAIGTGAANTNLILSGTTLIVSGVTGSSAAKFCYDLAIGGYTDWYLPSKDELNELYTQKAYISGLNLNGNYWSSSQTSSYCAWIQYFLTGTQSALGGKDQAYRVRPIRTI